MNKRETSLDIIRITATFFVISIHFFLNIKYYNNVVIGSIETYLIDFIRTISITCIPLFLMLTGYLKCNKKLDKDYYLNKNGLISIYLIYVIISIFTIAYKNVYLNQNINILNGIKGILNFKAANYAWYIEMYIGLYLLIPFLNIIWNNLKNKKQKQFLIFILFLCTILPSITNSFNISFKNGFNEIFKALNNSDKILPYWWVNLYPFTYYFIGAYIREFKDKIKIKQHWLIIILIICLLLFCGFNIYRSYGVTLRKEMFSRQSYGIEPFIMSILIFLFLCRLKYRKIPKLLNKIIIKLSSISLGIYLSSYIFDNLFYTCLLKYVSSYKEIILSYPIMIIIVFACSSILALLAYKIKDIIFKIVRVN